MSSWLRCSVWIHLVLCALGLGCRPVYAAIDEPALTTVRQVHDLPPELAAQRRAVDFVATVTYYGAATKTLFVEDATAAVYVKTSRMYPLRRGDVVRIQGFTAKSYRTRVGDDPKITVLHSGPRPQPTAIPGNAHQQLMAGTWDCRFVRVQGVVRSAMVEPQNNTRVLELEVMLPGGLVQVYVRNFTSLDVPGLEDAEVFVSGVAGADFNAKWQLMRSVLYAEDARDLKVLRKPSVDLTSLPLTSADEVVQAREVVDRSKRVRVRGSVTYYRPAHSVVIEQDGHSLFATTRETRPIATGSVVDVVGFAEDGGYGPALGQSKILLTGMQHSVQPATVNYAQAVSGKLSDNLITVRGRILSQVHTDAADTLSLAVDQHPVTIALERPADFAALPQLPAGTLVSVTGICRITTSSSWGDPGVTPMLFRIDMRSPEDLSVVRLPSWWTVTHLLFAVAGLLPLSLTVTVWAIALRRRVARQNSRIARTVRLEKERSRLLEAISSEASVESLLQAICAFVGEFGHGLRCSCIIASSGAEGDIQHRPITMGELPSPVLFRKTLADREGASIGLFSAGGTQEDQAALTEEQQEVAGIGASLIALAVSQRRLYHELNYTSSHDGLTGLPNRRSADARLEELLEEAARSGQSVGVAYIDVDQFKRVNDAHGHKIGDLYLQQIAGRLATAMRETDFLARVGGDEFLLIASPLPYVPMLEEIRVAVEACFDRDFLLNDVQISGSASVGFALLGQHGTTAEELRRHADLDMYAVKQRRRQASPAGEPSDEIVEVFTKADLAAALAADQFRLFYQPQFSQAGVFRGVEALLRLQDPILGMVMPDAFIDLAERSSLILPLGTWVLRQALADTKCWNLESIPDTRVIVNVSPQQIQHSRFADEVFLALDDAGLPPTVLELEITERSMVSDQEEARQQLKRLQAAGVHIAIDDFGVDHSCLSALHLFPIDTIKIDRSFVRAMSTEPLVLPILQAIVSMADCMQKRVVAEGVETQADVDALLGLGEMDLQGYFLGRPQPFGEISPKIEAWLSASSCAVHRV